MKLILSLALSTLLFSCSTQQKRQEVEAKASQSTVTDPKALGDSIQNAIQSSTSLTPEQKLKLEEIIAGNKKKAEEFSAESYKFRSVLINELLAEKVDHKKIKIIKKNINKIEKQKLANTFETIERITEVVSKSPDKSKFSEPLKQFERAVR